MHSDRTYVVLARGQVPCDLLFIGEAPGKSEDVIGQPFMGPAGKLQDSLVAEAVLPVNNARLTSGQKPVRVAYSNLCCCVPIGENGGVRPPEADEVLACSERLQEFVVMAKPQTVIAVGVEAKRWIPKVLDTSLFRFDSIDHPAFILRQKSASRSFMQQRAVVVIRSALENKPC